ncbi:TIM-barrel domain-containing protein [Candidatus Xianfuyuplasma coldseepsis]|uniref:Alpha-xylosidase n=1 Tax=Candidatus Xianfuyuplasma coldseepsis TaxID=2782163 RepID=A0A7L7KTA2_9MOLU|nr:TIM-barrel domain-containing protein [Xianfuyuplasma coldseepsis]QMS85466.1 alpha-xylosidase [Xianfuyuplasma coldseepsis]
MKSYITSNLQFTAHSQAEKTAYVQFSSYRITIFTNQLFRIEYDPSKQFEDRPTQTVWHRNITVPFEVSSNDSVHTITTKNWVIALDESKDQLDGLTITSIDGKTTITYPDSDSKNLNGTHRTLDMANGAIDLEPGLLSKRGITIYDDSSSVVFEQGEIVGVNNNEIDLYVFGYGHDYEQAIKDFYLVSGKTPLIPKYVFGNWWSRYWNYTDETYKAVINNFQQRNIPLSVAIIDMDWHITNVPQELRGGWTGYTWNKDLFPNPQAFMDWLHEKGLKISMNLHPADGIRPFDDCYEAVCKRMGIDPKDKQIIDFDLTNPLFIEAYFKDIHHVFEDQGVDFWWIDWQQGTQSKMKNLDPLFALNHYHFIDGLNRGKDHYFIFSRWSKLGSHRYPIGFSGDTFTTWESLDFQPYFTATASNVGYGWWSHDIGGHQGGTHDEELYTRWVQLGVFSPVMRLHSTKSYYSRREPWRYNQEVETTVKHFMQLRHQMIPYLHTFNHLHADGELPLIRPLYYQWPNEKKAYKYTNQYFFGTELMVRPFTSKTIKKLRMAKEQVWFKDGGWFHFFSGEYITNPGTYTFYGCMRDINVFAKEGAIIPFASNHENGLDDLPASLDIHLFPGNNNVFTLIEDQDGVVYKTSFTLTCTETSMTLMVQTTPKLSKNRTFNLLFRSVDIKSTVATDSAYETTKDSYNNTLRIQVPYDMDTPLDMTITSDNTILSNPFSFTEEIMNSIDLSALDTEEKNEIGYIDIVKPQESRGWLSWDKPLDEKVDDIDQLKIPKYAKKFIYKTAQRALKNDE